MAKQLGLNVNISRPEPGDTPRVRMFVPLWIYWWKIAEEHATEAREARQKEGIAEDMEPSMIAIAASASALGGLAGSVRRHAEIDLKPSPRGTPDATKILEILKHAFDLGSYGQQWLPRLRWLFDLRDPMVHHGERLNNAVEHPEKENLQVAPESLLYASPNATEAVELVREVVMICFSSPKPESDAWCELRRPHVERRLMIAGLIPPSQAFLDGH